MFEYNPLGCFIAETEGKRAGHVFSVSYGKLGWIGFLIVRADFRRKDVGTLLMQKAIDHLSSCGVETIRLEAVPEIAGLYRKLGFIDEYDSLRFVGVNQKISSAASSDAKLLNERKMKDIARFDAEYFGANRIKVLERLYRDYSDLCFASYEHPKITGYIMCRQGENGYRVGPWVCNPKNPQVAKKLLMKCMETINKNEKLYVGVPAVNKMAIEILQKFGFGQYSKSIRMYFGKKIKNECVSGILGIGGPEKG